MPFLSLYGSVSLLAAAVAVIWRRLLSNTGQAVHGRPLDTIVVAYLAGGANRAFHAAMLQTMQSGAFSVDRSGRIRMNSERRRFGDILHPYLKDGTTYKRARTAARQAFVSVRAELERRSLVLTPYQACKAALLPLLMFAPIVAFGIMKCLVGAERGRPVGILAFLIFMTLVGLAIAAWRWPLRSRPGEQELVDMGAASERLMRAPTETELPLALALVGAVVLQGTPLASLAATVRKAESMGESGCGGGDGCAA